MLPYAPWLVWLLPIFSSLLTPLVSRFSPKARNCFAVVVSLTALIFAISMLPEAYFNTLESPDLTVSWIPLVRINVGVYLDSMSILLACLVTFFGFVITLYSLGYMAGEEGLTRYCFFILLFIGSMAGLVLSDNFFQLFIFWEMVGLCSYSLISFWYKRPESVRAGVKVFLMTRVGDVCLLAGICLLYVNSGSFSFRYISSNIGQISPTVLAASAFLMLGGAIAKSAQLPLHTWLYSAMEAPTSVSALLHSATMVKAGVYLIARLIVLFGPLTASIPMWLPSILWIGTITAFVGATLALSTTDIKGVAAYSTISQIGFMFAALGTAYSTASPGWFAGVLHLIGHAFFQGLDFLLIGGIVHAVGTRDMRLMGGLRKEMPITFALSLVVMASRAGIPPLISFFSKELAIQSVLSSGYLFNYILLYVSTTLTFAYTLRVLTLVYLREKSDYLNQVHVHEAPKIMLLSAWILAAICLTAGLFVNKFSHIMEARLEIGMSEIFSFSTLALFFALSVGGISVYFAYYRRPSLPSLLMGKIQYIGALLKNGYFFDLFYEKGIAMGILAFSRNLKHVEAAFLNNAPLLVARLVLNFAYKIQRYLENTFFNSLPLLVAEGMLNLAYKTQKYLDILADELLYVIVKKILPSVSKIRKMSSNSINHYISAALIGFLIILTLVIITMLM